MQSFYSQLTAVLEAINKEKPTSQISIANVVTAGLRLKSVYEGQMRGGNYNPSLDRIEHLSRYLGVNPSIFDLYIVRYVQR